MAYYEQGLYECRIVGQGFDESKEKKTPYFWLRFEPEVDGNGNDVSGGYQQEVKLYLTDKTVERAVETLRGLGWFGNDWGELEPGGSHSFNGTVVKLRCMHSIEGDKTYCNWEFPGNASGSEHRGGMVKKLNALYGKHVKGGKPPKPAKQQPVADAAGVQEDDDIPF